MKLLILLAYLISSPLWAISDGQFINKDFQESDPSMFKTLAISQAKCEQGGAMIKFYGADVMNFCIGNNIKTIFPYKKCIGKEVANYPFKTCLGVKKIVDLVTTRIVTKGSENTIIVKEENFDDGELYFEQTYIFTDLGNDDIKITKSYNDTRDGRHGTNDFYFSK